ncbi:MAG: phage tail tape measure protein [Deltaproteobacteria bacterium]|nr:phage tail tape measure protein [Deltaproteobacteria bacterium]
MADLTKTVEIIFGGKNELSSIIGSLEKDFGKFERNVALPLSRVAEGVLKVDAALVALAVGGLALAIQKSGNFGMAFSEISTLIDATGKPIDEFRKQVQDYAAGSVKSIDDINKAVYTAISAGVDYKNSLDFVTLAEKLSVAGKADLEATTKTLASTLNAYSASVDEAGKYSDVLFQVVRKGQTTLPELSQSLAQVTPLAAACGIPIATLGAAIATLTANGMPTSQAMTALKGALTSLIKPSSEAVETAGKLGIEFSAAAVKSKGFEAVLADVNKTTGGNIEQIGKLFGSVEGLGGVLSLGGNESKKFNETLLAMKDAAGLTEAAYKKMADEVQLANQNMKNNADLVLISIGEKLTAGYGDLAGGLADIFKGVKIGIDAGAFDELFRLYEDTAKKSANFANAIANHIPQALKNVNFKDLAAAIDEINDHIADFFTASDNPEKLAKSIQFVVDSIESLIRVTEGIIEPFAPLINMASAAAKAFNNLDEDTKKLIGNVLGLSAAFKMFGPIGLLVMALGTDTETAAAVMNGSFLAIENGINTLRIAFASLGMIVAKAIEYSEIFWSKIPGSGVGTKELDAAASRVKDIGNYLDDAWIKSEVSSKKLMDALSGTGKATDGAKSKADEYAKAMSNIPTDVTTVLSADTFLALEEIGKLAVEQSKIKDINITAKADELSYKNVKDVMIKTLSDGTVVTCMTLVDEDSLIKTADKVEKALPKEKKIDISLEIAKVKEQSAIVQRSLEWSAKIDIAGIGATTEKIKTMFASIDAGIASSEKLMGGMFEALTKPGPYQYFIKEQIAKEEKRRQETFELQKKLIESQTKLLEMKVKTLEEGDSIIKISAEGLKPHLEMILWEVLEACQVRANEVSAEFLLGFKSE